MSVVWRCPSLGLDEVFRRDVHQLLDKSPFSWYVVSGFRSMAEQAALFKKYQSGGPKAAPPGRSAHNFGLAVDVVLDADSDKPGLQPSWDTKLPGWLWLKAAVFAHPRLHSGWKYGDWPHVQSTKWVAPRYPAGV